MFKKYLLSLVFIGCVLSKICFAFEREIAITIDDLPFVGEAKNDPAKLQRTRDRFISMMQVLIDNKVPATGFVIAGAIENGQWQLLEQFLQAGFIIGNHTYSHMNLNAASAKKYIENVDKADQILAPLMSEPKYFRYPFLAEGRGDKKQQVQEHLAANHYVVAPVTIDSKDFLFNERLYKIPYRFRAQKLNQIKKKYLAYIWSQTLKAENRAKKNQDKSAKQILLIHANLLNSYLMKDIVELYKKNGYRFISLPEALEQSTPAVNISSDMPGFEMMFEDKDNVINLLLNHHQS